MFLPVMLMRDMGVASFAAFAVPNCIGAMFLAWWMKSKGASHAFVTTHLHAIRAFSLITLTFQWFFVAWIAMRGGFSLQALALIAVFLVPLFLLPRSLLADGPRRSFSIGVYASSVALLTWFVLTHDVIGAVKTLPPPDRSPDHIWPLLAVCSLGFLCCPLLDGTFHLTKQRSESASGKAEFAIGFVVLFALLICGTVAYGAWLLVDSRTNQNPYSAVPANLPLIASIYILLQLGFTIAAHERWLGMPRPAGGAAGGVSLAAAIAGLLLGTFGPTLIQATNLNTVALGIYPNEVIYRCFMAFYGLLAPLYVLGCCLHFGPFARSAPGPSVPRLLALVAVAAIATPFYYKGFIERETPSLFAGVTVAIVGAIAARFLPASSASAPFRA
jgi:hypothetical protein